MHLLQLAQSAGVEVLTGWAFTDRKDGLLIFRNQDGEEIHEECNVILAGDGARSQVLSTFKIPRPPILLLLQAKVQLPEWAQPEIAIVWFIPEDTPYFYWLIPDSKKNRSAWTDY
uniref:FAD-binding domain-containing protein n=1 Tax=candidate division WOR-3 bacterium TaxID=2052148 RepID=A0A7V3RGV0_UNCW3